MYRDNGVALRGDEGFVGRKEDIDHRETMTLARKEYVHIYVCVHTDSAQDNEDEGQRGYKGTDTEKEKGSDGRNRRSVHVYRRQCKYTPCAESEKGERSKDKTVQSGAKRQEVELNGMGPSQAFTKLLLFWLTAKQSLSERIKPLITSKSSPPPWTFISESEMSHRPPPKWEKQGKEGIKTNLVENPKRKSQTLHRIEVLVTSVASHRRKEGMQKRKRGTETN